MNHFTSEPATSLRTQMLAPGITVVSFPAANRMEYHLTARLRGNGDLHAVGASLAGFLLEHKAQIVSVDVFGMNARFAHPLLDDMLNGIPCPVTWVEEGCEHPEPIGGIQIWAVSGPAVTELHVDGQSAGMIFEDDYARYCRVGGLTSSDPALPREDQGREVFARMVRVLGAAGMDFSQVVRTWYYNDHLLDWYGPFNGVRNAFFKEHRVYEGMVPASTGIGGHNAAGTALMVGLLAVLPKDPAYSVFAVPSPLQCPALDYGSSFSRAVELAIPGVRRLFISGTASIAPGGESVHLGDTDAQTDLTMRVVAAILESRGMTWANATRAVAYVKNLGDADCMPRYLAARQLADLPAVITCNDVCRDDLLYEIEVEAAILE